MFEVAEVGHKLAPEAYEAQAAALRGQLLDLQRQLAARPFSVVVVLAGVDAAGKSESANQIARWLDSRYVRVTAYDTPSEEARLRPEMWRYWRDLPPHGRIGVVLSSWYSRPVTEHAHGRLSDEGLDQALRRIVTFEQALVDDGTLVLKIWLHLSEKAQKKRLARLAADPLESWRVGPEQKRNLKRFDGFVAAAERVITTTSNGRARWHIVEGADRRYREVAVATLLRDALAARLAAPDEVGPHAPMPPPPPRRTLLDQLPSTSPVSRAQYDREIKEQGARIAHLAREAQAASIPTVLVFEGWDAAGKGGAITRLTDFLDARAYRVHSIAAPTPEERRRHWLWRFWTRLERAGRFTIFDRSWYGRVLVERVEGFCSPAAWQRAPSEIRNFEAELVGAGAVLVKLWMHVSAEEQLRRFQERATDPHKQHKLTDEDRRNRDKRPAYEDAIDEMAGGASTIATTRNTSQWPVSFRYAAPTATSASGARWTSNRTTPAPNQRSREPRVMTTPTSRSRSRSDSGGTTLETSGRGVLRRPAGV